MSGQGRITCDRCGASNVADAEFCASPHCRTYLGWDEHPPVSPAAPAAPVESAGAALWLEIADPHLAVDPGHRVTTTVTVLNRGDRAEELALAVVGPPAPFGAVDPPVLTAYPGTTTTCAVTFAPPRTPDCPAGHIGYGVQATSASGRTVAGATLAVGAYADVTAELAPPAARSRWRTVHYLTLTNNGNTVQRLHLAVTDPARALDVDFGGTALDLPPGRVTVPVGVRARAALAGAARHFPFDIVVSAVDGSQLARVTGTRTAPAWVPAWAAAVVAVVAALVLLGSGINVATARAAGMTTGAAAPRAAPQGAASKPGPASARDTVAAGARWIRPVPAGVVSGFRTPERPEHDGVDLGAPRNTVIRAASAGLVVTVLCNVDGRFFRPDTGPVPCDTDGSPGLGGCGWYVEVRHAGGILTRYCHMVQQPAVRVGQAVPLGQPLGFVGTSGNSSGPHLHFETHVRVAGMGGADIDQPVDPVPFMARRGVRL